MKPKNQFVGVLVVALLVCILSIVASDRVRGESQASESKITRQVVDLEVSHEGNCIWRIWNDGTVEQMFPEPYGKSKDWIPVAK